MRQVYLNINNDLINDIFNLDDPDEFVIDETILDMIDSNSSPKKSKKEKADKSNKEKSTNKKAKKEEKSEKKKIKIKIRRKK